MAYLGHITCAVIVACDNGKSIRQSHHDTDQEEHKTARRADCGKRVDTEYTTDDQGVDKTIHLLQDIADDKRDRKKQDQTKRICAISAGRLKTLNILS